MQNTETIKKHYVFKNLFSALEDISEKGGQDHDIILIILVSIRHARIFTIEKEKERMFTTCDSMENDSSKF